MNRPAPTVHRLSGVQSASSTLEHALSEALDLCNASALESESLEILQTLSPLFPHTSPTALAAAGILLQAPADGHTCLTAAAIARRFEISDALSHDAPASRDDEKTQRIAQALIEAADFCAPWDAQNAQYPPNAPFVHAFERFYLHRAAVTEHGISQALQDRLTLDRETVDDLETLLAPLQDRMHAAQFRAVHTALNQSFMLLTGGPGTGKTWTVRTLLAVEYIAALRVGKPLPRVALAAPTGKAAARMLESMHVGLDAFIDDIGRDIAQNHTEHLTALRHQIQQLSAQTLHRLLQVHARQPEPAVIHADLVIIDEVSMVDAPMMHRLLTSLSHNTRLILIGDPHQLASVEAGSVLSDFVALAAQTPTLQKHVVELTSSRRFTADSLVGQLATATLNHQPNADAWRRALRPLPQGRELNEDILHELSDGFIPLMRAAEATSEFLGAEEEEAQRDERARRALQALSSFQILCAHHQGPRSVRTLNEAITRTLIQRQKMRPAGAGGLSVGMPIMILRNDYSLQRYNGDIGVVTSPGIVSFPKEDGGIQHVAVARLPEHRVAFAITVHKSQGSEWQDVRFLLPPQPSRILTRELVYTAISRAKERIDILGSAEVLKRGLAHKADRATGLVDVISAHVQARSTKSPLVPM